MAKQKPKQKLLEVEHVSEAEITSLNGNLLNEFSIEELETRYETDPLMLSHLFGIVSTDNADISATGCICKGIKCPELECVCKGELSVCACDGVREGDTCPVKATCPEYDCSVKKS